jgi:hypothetical protein
VTIASVNTRASISAVRDRVWMSFFMSSQGSSDSWRGTRPLKPVRLQASYGRGWKTLFGRRYSGSSKPCWEEEVIELLGRQKSVRRPHLRGLAERFVRRLLSLFQHRTKQMGKLLPNCTCMAWRWEISR